MSEETTQTIGDWEYEGKKYPLFLINSIGGIEVLHKDNETGETLGKISAIFSWNNKDAMLQSMEYGSQRIIDKDGNITRKANDSQELNIKTFRDTVKSGGYSAFEKGEFQETRFFNRDEMLQLQPEVQSDLFFNYAENIHFKQIRKESGVNALFGSASQKQPIFIEVKIGNKEKPQHILVLECEQPSVSARQEMRQKLSDRIEKNENGKQIFEIVSSVHYRMQQFRHYVKNVEGAVIGDKVIVFDKLKDEHFKMLNQKFNPIWQVLLIDYLFDLFNFSGKLN